MTTPSTDVTCAAKGGALPLAADDLDGQIDLWMFYMASMFGVQGTILNEIYGQSTPTTPSRIDTLYSNLAAAVATLGKVRATEFYASDFGLSESNTGTDADLNSAAIQATIDACHAAGGGKAICDVPGEYEVALVAHPNGSASFTKCVAAIRPGVELCGVGRHLVTLKVTDNPNAGLQSGGQNRFLINWNPTASGTVDENFGVSDLTLDGNCLNVGAGDGGGSDPTPFIMHGIQFWYGRHVRIERLIVKNMRGNDTNQEETFHVDALRCQDVVYDDVLVTCDDGGNTSSGFSMNWVDRFWAERCTALGVGGQGFTWYSSANGLTSNCYAGDTKYGFNMEHSWDLAYVNCDAGGEAPNVSWQASSDENDPIVFDNGDTHPNTRGFMMNLTRGGGRIQYVNCTSRNSTDANVGIIGSTSWTATSGTATNVVVVTSDQAFTKACIGRYIKVGSGNWVRITGYTSETQVTTHANHGGSSGNTVLMMSGDVVWEGGNVGGGTKGIQFYDANDDLKRLSARRSDFTNARFGEHTSKDLEDCGHESGGGTPGDALASGRAGTAMTSALASGVEFYNPFPMDMRVTCSAGQGDVSIRGSHPLDASTPTGQTGQASYDVPCGGAITVSTVVTDDDPLEFVGWWYPR